MTDHAMRTCALILDEERTSKCAQLLVFLVEIGPNDFRLLDARRDSTPALLADWTEIRDRGSIK